MACMVQVEDVAALHPDMRPNLKLWHGEGVGIAGAERYHDGIYRRERANRLDAQIARLCPSNSPGVSRL